MTLDRAERLSALDAAIDSTLAGVPLGLRSARDELPRLLGKERLGSRWSERFKPLTLLFPALALGVSSEGEHVHGMRMAEEDLQASCHAHALLVLASFLEDRLLDRQARRLPGRQELVEHLRERARQLIAPRCEPEEAFDQCLRAAVLGSRGTFPEVRSAASMGVASFAREVRQVVVARAASGFLVAELLSSLDASSHALLADVFAGVAVALQWLDDYDDLVADVQAERDNLLVCLACFGDEFLVVDEPKGSRFAARRAHGCPVHERALGELAQAAHGADRIRLGALAEEIDRFAKTVEQRLSPELGLGTRMRLAVLAGSSGPESRA